MSLEEALDELSSSKNIKFFSLLKICCYFFEGPRIEGSHHIFKTPWKGQPWLNLQRDGKMAKTYQVKQVKLALLKMREIRNGDENEA